MKFKRLTAIVLTLVMLFSILPLTGTVYATGNEEKEVDVTTADYPIMIKDRINTARLTKIGQYSDPTGDSSAGQAEVKRIRLRITGITK